ncbi:MAG: hypothetical protein JWN84_3112 [Nocardioides sp.]|nr:hypothetical protein [Nocardioides sp.]
MNRQLLVGIAGAAALLVVAVALTLFLRGDDEEPAIEGLETFSGYDAGLHEEGPVTYEENPPVGGPHFAAWLKCGVYDEPIPNEAAVHDLEHGAVWITYDADALSDEQVATLEDALPEQGIMSPYPGLDSPVVLSAWERQLRLDSVDDPRLAEFVEAYESAEQAPERNVGCDSGGSLEDLEGLGVPPAPAA